MYKMTMEEVPNNECINVGPKLPEGMTALLMTKKEYLDTLWKGEKPAPTMKTPPKMPEFQCKSPEYEQECQLTFSKVKVEDLVIHDEEPSMSTSTHSFWNRPISKPQFNWPYDPWMPPEWNHMVASMQTHGGNQYIPRGEMYHNPLSDKILEPEEFTAKYKLSPESSKKPSAQLNPWWSNANLDFGELHTQFTRPKIGKSLPEPQTNSSGYTQAKKGKSNVSNLRLSKDDYPQLQQQ